MKNASDMTELLIWHALYQLEAKHWHEVDFNGGSLVHELYCQDGLFAVGPNQFKGRHSIQLFYEWRRARGSTARHVFTNLVALVKDEWRATATGLITIYRAQGSAPLRAGNIPALVADFASDCILDPDGTWRYVSHILRPVFIGTDTPLSLAVDPAFLAYARSRAASVDPSSRFPAAQRLPKGDGLTTEA